MSRLIGAATLDATRVGMRTTLGLSRQDIELPCANRLLEIL